MKKGYIVKGDSAYISDDEGLIERPAHPNIDKIVKHQSILEILNALYKEKEQDEQDRLDETEKYYRKSLMIPLLILSLPILLLSPELLSMLVTAIFPTIESSATISFYRDIYPGYLVAYPAAVIAFIYYWVKEHFSEKVARQLGVSTSYLDAQISETTDTLEHLEEDISAPIDYEEGQIASLSEFNDEYTESIKRRADLIEELVAIKDVLNEARRERRIDKLVEDGYTREEIQKCSIELDKIISLEPVKEQ